MAPVEHRVYARWLDIGTRIGLALLVAGFAVYAFGLLEAHIAPQELARYWALPVDSHIRATGAPTGWGWLGLLHKGDYLNFVGITVFASITLACYARIIPLLIARGERLHAAIAAAQLVILAAALSGLVV
jgi:hypothetical protein